VDFEDVLNEGLAIDVEAFWGAGFLDGRYRPGQVSWDWTAEARPWLDDARRALDMGTGEGGVLAGLVPLPPLTVAYEEWPPTIPAAKAVLRPIGVHLVQALGGADNVGSPDRSDRPGLPFASGAFDLVLNRHEAFHPAEVRRVTGVGGTFLTQQVGSDEATSVRALFDLPTDGPVWDASVAVAQLRAAGWRIDDVREERPLSEFTDIGALVAYVRSLPWAYPDLDLTAALPRLRQLHEQSRVRPIPAVTHRFLVRATR
jgi:hypothetical protein